MRYFECCLDCEQRCEDCHSTCQPYKREKTVYNLFQKQIQRKQMQNTEYNGYEKSKKKKIEQAARRKHK